MLAAAVTCLATALVLDLTGAGSCAPDGAGVAGLAFLVLAAAFPHWPRRR